MFILFKQLSPQWYERKPIAEYPALEPSQDSVASNVERCGMSSHEGLLYYASCWRVMLKVFQENFWRKQRDRGYPHDPLEP